MTLQYSHDEFDEFDEFDKYGEYHNLSYGELIKLVKHLRTSNTALEKENALLRKESADYLNKWVQAQDLAYNRQVTSLLSKD